MRKGQTFYKSVFLDFVLSAALQLLFTGNIYGATKTWAGPFLGLGNGDWNTAGNWSPSGVPTNTDDVIFNELALDYTVSLSGSAVASTITINGFVGLLGGVTINTNGQSLTVLNSLNVGAVSLILPVSLSMLGSGMINFNTAVNISGGGTLSLGSGSDNTTNVTLSGTAITYNGASTLSNYGSLTSSSAAVFNLSGSSSLINNFGSFNANSSTLNLSGNSSTIANTGTFNLGTASVISVTGTSALVSNTSNFTLLSDASGTATIGAIGLTSSGFSGQYNVQRCITGGAGYRGYRILSSPVSVGSDIYSNKICSINYIVNSTYVSGTSFPVSAYSKAGNPSFYLYRENLAPLYTSFLNSNNRGVKNISSSTTYTIDGDAGNFNIPIGNGIMYFFRGGLATVNAFITAATPVTATVTARGSLTQGDVQVVNWYNPISTTLGYTVIAGTTATPLGNSTTRGFNIIGNPYASPIDWSKLNNITNDIVAVNINPQIWELKPGTNTYSTYNAGTNIALNGGSAIIASGQGFFLKATSGGPATLKFTENAKSLTQPSGFTFLASAYAANTAYSQYMILNVSKDNTNKCEVLIGFNPNSNKKYNQMEDDLYLSGQRAPQSMWITSADNFKVVSKWMSLPKANKVDTVNLNVTALTSGLYTITRSELKVIPSLFNIWLMDKYKKDSLDIKHNFTYAFNLNHSDTNSYGAHRFQLIIRQDPALRIHLLDFTAVQASNGVKIAWKIENEEDYTHFTVERSTDNGVVFDAFSDFSSNARQAYNFLDNSPANTLDLYRLKIRDLDSVISYSKVIKLTYNPGKTAVASENINVYPNPAIDVINVSVNQYGLPYFKLSRIQNTTISESLLTKTTYAIKIINVSGVLIKSAISSQPAWQNDVSTLLPGTYILQVVNNKDKTLVGKTTFVKL